MKKVVVTLLIIVAVLVLIYVFIKNGYSGIGNGSNLLQMTSTNTAGPNETQVPSQTVTPAVSSKITLNVTSPTDGETLSSTNVTVKGKTAPNADVFVNDVTGKADANGNFSVSLGLDEGSNQIVVSANDLVGNATQTELTVTVASFQ